MLILIVLFLVFKPTTFTYIIDNQIDVNNYEKLTAILHGPESTMYSNKLEITDKQTINDLFTYFNKLKLCRSFAKEFDTTNTKTYILVFYRKDNTTIIISTYGKKYISIGSYRYNKWVML
ncbi:hypothetical protein [Abyssisolibacter fermentans]|uniref:hypothetical protein n=1 Tax=Abyssisolibacter fermentans TaxID=1766203 RepID=UPI00082ABC16|nr:hypothetical protein [Abyssisolibacter fermentans]